MSNQKVVIPKNRKMSETLDDVNVDERTLEFLTGTFGDTLSSTTDGSRRPSTPHDLVDMESDPILAHDITTRNRVERILKLRKFVHRQALLSERAGAIGIRQLIQIKKMFETDLSSSDPLLKKDELGLLFYHLDDIKTIVDDLSGRLEEAYVNWSSGVRIFPAYQCVLDKLDFFKDYANNLIEARKIIEIKGGPEVFDDIISGDLPMIDKPFDDLLQQPIRLQKRAAYSMREILKYTPEEHNDHEDLKNALRKVAHLLDNFWFIPKQPGESCAFYILKSGYVVQIKNNIRKLRYLFLFPTCLILTKPRLAYKDVKYGIKEIIRLESINWEVIENISDENLEETKDAQKNLIDTKADLEKFIRNSNSNQTIFKKWVSSRLKQKIYKNEAKLMLFTPNIKLLIENTADKTKYTFILTSHFDVDDWIENLEAVKNDSTTKTHTEDIYRNSIKDFQLVPRLIAFKPETTVNRYLNGTLDVFIHQVKGFQCPQNSYLTLQVDCFGGFYMREYTTRRCINKKEPIFNQKFEILLDSSHLLKISLYVLPENSDKCSLKGSAIFDMQSASLHSGYRLVTLQLYPKQSLIVAMSLRYAYHQVGYKRKYSVIPSNSLERVKSMRGKVFGEELDTVVKRESRKIPLVVTSCVEEVELRGMDSEYIYNVGGHSEHLKDLKSVFDLCSLTGARYIKDRKYSATTIGCLLLKYLEKLPTPLIMEPTKFIATNDSGTEQKSKILNLIQNLPTNEKEIFCYLINHLVNVMQHKEKNKMGIEELARVFGPCFLQVDKLSASPDALEGIEKFSKSIQSVIELKIKGVDLLQ